jgi:hypothetical protein
MKEPICKLCKQNPATKTNSHILPFSLIRENINYEASVKRDKEAVYTVSTARAPTRYVGRSVLPEQVEAIIQGFESVETEQSNTTTEDHLFCPGCENRFSVIETYFSEQAINFLKSRKNLFAEQDRLVPLKSTNDPYLIKLYVLSLFWRTSVSVIYDHFSLNGADEELIRMSLNTCLDDNIDIILEKLSEQDKSLLDTFSIIITYAQDLDDPTAGINHVESFQSNAYLLLTNRFSFMLFLGGSQNVDLSPYLYGINQFTQQKELILNDPKPVYIAKIFQSEWKHIIANLLEGFVKDFIHHKAEVFRHGYRMLFGTRPNEQYVHQLKQRVAELGADVTNDQLISLIVDQLRALPEVQQLMNEH